MANPPSRHIWPRGRSCDRYGSAVRTCAFQSQLTFRHSFLVLLLPCVPFHACLAFLMACARSRTLGYGPWESVKPFPPYQLSTSL